MLVSSYVALSLYARTTHGVVFSLPFGLNFLVWLEPFGESKSFVYQLSTSFQTIVMWYIDWLQFKQVVQYYYFRNMPYD